MLKTIVQDETRAKAGSIDRSANYSGQATQRTRAKQRDGQHIDGRADRHTTHQANRSPRVSRQRVTPRPFDFDDVDSAHAGVIDTPGTTATACWPLQSATVCILQTQAVFVRIESKLERDSYMSAQEALEFGIVDEVVLNRPPTKDEADKSGDKSGALKT